MFTGGGGEGVVMGGGGAVGLIVVLLQFDEVPVFSSPLLIHLSPPHL